MTAQARHRSRFKGPFNGDGFLEERRFSHGHEYFYQRFDNQPSVGTEVTDDFITIAGSRTPNDFRSYKAYGYRWTFDGKYESFVGGGWQRRTVIELDNYFTTSGGNSIGYTTKIIPEVNLNIWKNHILSSLGVADPAVDIPLFLFELKDFPRMLRDFIRIRRQEISISDVPGQYLGYNFGWKPLVSDLASLLDLAGEMENRLKYLNSIQSGKRIKRVLENTSDQFVESTGNSVKGVAHFKVEETRTRKTWFTARVGAVDEDLLDDLQSLYRKARAGNSEALLDVRRRLLNLKSLRQFDQTLWNAIPWTWLIDYFVSIGDFIQARKAVIPFKPYNVCVMEHFHSTRVPTLTSKYSGPSTVENSIGLSRGKIHIDLKRREVITVLKPTIHIEPFLSVRQRGILGALVTASVLRRS